MANVLMRLTGISLLAGLSACSSSGSGSDQDQTSSGSGGAVGIASGGSATGGGSTGAAPSATPAGGVLPCAIDTLVKARCQTCHGQTPIGGAPMSLVTEADFQQDYTVRTSTGLVGQTMKLYQLARMRINGTNGLQKMPQGNPLSPSDFSTLDAWLASGVPAGMACLPVSGAGGYIGSGAAPGAGGSIGTGSGGDVTGAGLAPTVGGATGAGSSPAAGGSAGTGAAPGAGGVLNTSGSIVSPNTPDQCANDPDQFKPLVAEPGETCYEFQVHGVSSPTDKSKFTIPTGQTYNQFYYDIPWPAGTVATRFGAKFDNLKVLHHWLAFGIVAGGMAAGTVQPNVLGTTLGQGAELIGGWAVGGCNVFFQKDMGLKLPATGQIMIQWHHYNSTGGPAEDGTSVQFCTVPENMRPNIGGLTFLGTENFNGLAGMPPGQVSKFSGTCTNNSGKPITIVGYNPHMHLLGTNMTSVVMHKGGKQETVFDHPFQFDHQVNYLLNPGYVLLPGESITSTCTFNNTTSASVAFGQSTMQEMCYQFTFAYPYGALNNGVISLIGATNTCW